MRATGRRIGRIVGQLDDLRILMDHYLESEEADGDDEASLLMVNIYHDLTTAHEQAVTLAARLNETKRSG